MPYRVLRFEDFELDVEAGILLRGGMPIKLERRPFDLLMLLLEERGKLVSRQSIEGRLWKDAVFVDAETGINTAIRKLRRALNDDPDRPTFIETVSGRGYRFIAKVDRGPDMQSGDHVLAVLPFRNQLSDPDRGYISDGLTDETIVALGQLAADRLRVIGRTTSMAYKDSKKTLRQIAQELRADYLIEGSVRSEGERLRVTAALVRAEDEAQVWSGTFDASPKSTLAFQCELSSVISRQIHLHLQEARVHALERRHSAIPEAYDLYMRGRHYWYQLTAPTTRLAIECFRRAVEIDADFALAWSGLADCFSSGPIHADAVPREIWQRARHAAARALECAPQLPETHTTQGLLQLFLEWNFAAADRSFRYAIELNRNFAFAHRMLGVTLSHMSHHEEAIASLRRARELDPLYAMHFSLSSMAAFHAKDFVSAIELAMHAIEIDPNFWVGYMHLAQAYERNGAPELALSALDRAQSLSSANSKVAGLRGYILATSGRVEESIELLRSLESASKSRYIPPYNIALIHAALEQEKQCILWLERAYDAHDVHLIFLPVDPKWDRYRGLAAFADLVSRCGLKQAETAYSSDGSAGQSGYSLTAADFARHAEPPR